MDNEFEPKEDRSNVFHAFELGPANFYGVLTAAKTMDAMGNEYYWWGIENWNGYDWHQIGKPLFEELTCYAENGAWQEDEEWTGW